MKKMLRSLHVIVHLGIKELFSLRRDIVMLILILYAFSMAIYTPSKNAQTELRNASVAIVDEDQSLLSMRLRDVLMPPFFQKPVLINLGEIDRQMDLGVYTFVIDIPAEFEADLLAGRDAVIQLNVDATAMTQAGLGASYIRRIISDEITLFLNRQVPEAQAVGLNIRVNFNPNLNATWFLSIVQLINMITMMAMILTGAALIREREHGTVEHLLVMPLSAYQIMVAKVWANALVIVVASYLSLKLIVELALDVPIIGSIPLFIVGLATYLFAVTALGILLATIARSMPQFGLLAFPVFIVMNLLSGGITPLDSAPQWLQYTMQLSPSTHFVQFSQTVLYRGGGFAFVWQEVSTMLVIGVVFFLLALSRFRKTLAFA